MPRWLKSQSLGAASDLYYNLTTFSQYYVCTYLHYTTFCSYEVPGPCMTGGTRVRYQVTTFLGTVNVDWEALSMHTDIRNCPMRCLENVKFRGVKLRKTNDPWVVLQVRSNQFHSHQFIHLGRNDMYLANLYLHRYLSKLTPYAVKRSI